MGGDTPETGSLIPLAFSHSLIWALCQVSFSTLDCKMNAFLGAVVTGRMEAASPFTCLATHTHVASCIDVTAVQRREWVNKSHPIDLKRGEKTPTWELKGAVISLPNPSEYSATLHRKGWSPNLHMVGIYHLIVPLPTSKDILHKAKSHVEPFLASLANFLCDRGQSS